MRISRFIVAWFITMSVIVIACGEEEAFPSSSGRVEVTEAVPIAAYLQRMEVSGDSEAVPAPDVLASLDIPSVTTPEELAAVVDEVQPLSIWIDVEMLPDISSTWLQFQLRSGRVIVGINATTSQLAAQMRVHTGEHATQDLKADGVSMFVAYYEVLYEYTNPLGEPALGFSSGWRNDEFDPLDLSAITGFVRHAAADIASTKSYTEPAIPAPEVYTSTVQ